MFITFVHPLIEFQSNHWVFNNIEEFYNVLHAIFCPRCEDKRRERLGRDDQWGKWQFEYPNSIFLGWLLEKLAAQCTLGNPSTWVNPKKGRTKGQLSTKERPHNKKCSTNYNLHLKQWPSGWPIKTKTKLITDNYKEQSRPTYNCILSEIFYSMYYPYGFCFNVSNKFVEKCRKIQNTLGLFLWMAVCSFIVSISNIMCLYAV